MTLLTLFTAVANGTITPQDAEREAVALLVTVKPLLWWGNDSEQTAYEGDSDKVLYVTKIWKDGRAVIEYPGRLKSTKPYKNVGEADAAAQADYTARILSALTLAPKEDAR